MVILLYSAYAVEHRKWLMGSEWTRDYVHVHTYPGQTIGVPRRGARTLASAEEQRVEGTAEARICGFLSVADPGGGESGVVYSQTLTPHCTSHVPLSNYIIMAHWS